MSNTVSTAQGAISGTLDDGLAVFRGIPYAAPPIGANRWLAPQPHPGWDGVLEASAFGAEAPQNPSALDSMMGATGEPPARDEDCLFLNIWTPGTDDARRPVLFWIHGGGFTIGSGSSAVYDGQYLAREGDVVVVTINYRMGALGFMNLAALTDGRIPATGNEGLLDQIAALEWVRDNIAAFGGDPGNVTIFGESAGGMSCGALLAMPRAQGLFHKAIPQSGACHTAISMDQARSVAETTLELLGVGTDAEALMALPEAALTAVQQKVSEVAAERGLPGMSFQPVIDGTELPNLPIECVREGSAAGVAIMAGSTADEWKLFAGIGQADPVDEAALAAQGETLFEGGAGAAGVAAYKAQLEARGVGSSAGDIMAAMATDRVFRLPWTLLLAAQVNHDSRVYGYRFDFPAALMGGALGACHAVELGFVFGTHDKDGAANFFGAGEAAEQVSAVTRAAWLNFARTGHPAGGLVPEWPAYGVDNRATMVINTATAVEISPDEDTRALWREDALGAL